MKSPAMKLKQVLYPFIPLLAVTGLAEFLSRKGYVASFLMPAPTQVFYAMSDDSTEFRNAFLQTLFSSGLGLICSMIFGLTSALILSFSALIRTMFFPYAIFFQTVPIIAIAPLLVIWLGYGLPTVIASAFIVSVFPVIANSVMGLLGTDPTLLNLFKVLGAKPLQILFKLRLPSALPQILGGFKIAAGLSVIGTIVGEFISGSGLGGLVDAAKNQQRVDRVFAAVVLAAFLGIFYFSLISFLNWLLLKHWKETA